MSMGTTYLIPFDQNSASCLFVSSTRATVAPFQKLSPRPWGIWSHTVTDSIGSSPCRHPLRGQFNPLLSWPMALVAHSAFLWSIASRQPREATQLKGITDAKRRQELLDGLYEVDPIHTGGGNILLFDDLFRSGATMNAITDVLMRQGKAANVRAFTITRTRSNQ